LRISQYFIVLFAKICIGHFITQDILLFRLDQCTALMCTKCALVRPIKFAITFIVICVHARNQLKINPKA